MNTIVEHNVDVPVGDGTILRANVFRPDAGGTYPGILLRTPYGKPEGGFERFIRSGYAVVTQDSRGRFDSDGEWVPFTVENTGDAEDGYDSVGWLAKQPWCNGRVGTMGASYNAWMQWQLAKLRPPHLEAMVAYTIPLELTEVDYPGGFRPGRRIRWWICSMAPDLRRRHGTERTPHKTGS
jgi:putative CocE/NonD family hydrolase